MEKGKKNSSLRKQEGGPSERKDRIRRATGPWCRREPLERARPVFPAENSKWTWLQVVVFFSALLPPPPTFVFEIAVFNVARKIFVCKIVVGKTITIDYNIPTMQFSNELGGNNSF